MNILEEIMAERRAAVAEARKTTPISGLRDAAGRRRFRSLKAVLRETEGTRIVAEVKKASPSAGLLREEYDPAGIAAMYRDHGAAGISVLTEPLHFMGAGVHLSEVRRAVDLPILRKDFFCDPYQLYEAAAWGADVALLIVAALEKEELLGLYEAAIDLGLEVLVEAHTAEELRIACELEDAIIGINSRNLKTLRTDLRVAEELISHVPDGRPILAESGIRERADVERLEKAGYSGFLVGETLLRAEDPGQKLCRLLGSVE